MKHTRIAFILFLVLSLLLTASCTLEPTERNSSNDSEPEQAKIWTIDPPAEETRSETKETPAPSVETVPPEPEPIPEPEPEPEVLALSETEAPAQDVTRETPDPLFPTYEREETVEYVLNTSSKKIHKPTCKDVPKIKPENYSTTETPDEYLAKGYTNCGHCGGCS